MSQSFSFKRMSRLAAIQFAYQFEVNSGDFAQAVKNFMVFMQNNEEYKNVSYSFFKRLVRNLANISVLNAEIEKSLTSRRGVANLSLMELCILRIAVIEMIYERTDIPVIINEYVEISKEFLDKKNVRFINAFLDTLAKNVTRRCLEV